MDIEYLEPWMDLTHSLRRERKKEREEEEEECEEKKKNVNKKDFRE